MIVLSSHLRLTSYNHCFSKTEGRFRSKVLLLPVHIEHLTQYLVVVPLQIGPFGQSVHLALARQTIFLSLLKRVLSINEAEIRSISPSDVQHRLNKSENLPVTSHLTSLAHTPYSPLYNVSRLTHFSSTDALGTSGLSSSTSTCVLCLTKVRKSAMLTTPSSLKSAI